MVLATISGDLGSGKTWLATYLALILSRFTQLIPNYDLDLPNVIPFDLNDFLAGKYYNCCVILDEAYIYLESRVSSSNLNRAMSHILFQSRKRDCDVILTVQLNDTIDLRVRELSKIYIIAQARENRFIYDIYKRKANHEWKHFKKCINKPIAQQFYGLYDTRQVITNDDNAIPLAHRFSEQEITELASAFTNTGKKPTKTNILGFLRLKRLPLSLSDSIHYLVKE